MALNTKNYLDFEGLAQYDALIKKYIDEQNNKDQDSVQDLLEDLGLYQEATDKAIEEAKAALTAQAAALEETQKALEDQAEQIGGIEEDVATNTAALDVLNGDGEGSVKKAVSDAIADVVDSAPETFDTLKEIADWIANDETASAALVEKVTANEEAIAANAEAIEANAAEIKALQNQAEDIKSYVDEADKNVYDSIGAINNMNIAMLFMDEVKVEKDASVADAIANVQEGEKLVLDSDAVVAEDLNVPTGVVIDANGATLSGNVTVSEDAVIVNAVFTGTVTVA